MVLKQLELLRFKHFLNHRVDFQPGFNVIRGPNESGKSTLRRALLTAFFGNPTSSSEGVKALTTWGQSERCELRLEYLDENGQTCRLRKDFAANKIFLLRGEESFRTLKTIQNYLQATLGIPTEELYELCASLDVRSLGNFGSLTDRKQVGKMLAGLMTGSAAGQDVLQVLKRLDDAQRELVKGERAAAKTAGPIKAARERLTKLRAKLAETQSLLKSRGQQLQTYQALSSDTVNNEAELAQTERLLQANRKISEAEKRKRELAAQDADFEKNARAVGSWESRATAVRTALEQEKAARLAPEAIEELRTLLLTRSQPAPRVSVHRDPIARILMICGSVVGLAGLTLFFFKWMVGLLVLISGAGTWIAGWMKKTAIREQERRHNQETSEWQAAGAALDRRLHEFQEQAQGLEGEAILSSWERAQSLRTEKQAMERQLGEMPAIDHERWQEVRRDLRLTEDVLQSTELAPLRLAPADFASRQHTFHSLETRLSEQREQKSRLQALLDHSQGQLDGVAELDEEIAESRERLAYLEERARVCRLTHELLDQARRDTLNPARQVLENRAGELFAVMSRGRYQNIAVDDEDLSSKILVTETGKWETPDVLSQGAFDQFYLSLRLALSEILAGGRKPPLLLDEPLTAFDPDRMAAALAHLRQIAQERQVLFFTCRPDYDDAADHVIRL